MAVVALADDLFFTGRTIILYHGCGLHSIPAQQSTIAVADGDRFGTRRVLGEVGSAGRTGPISSGACASNAHTWIHCPSSRSLRPDSEQPYI